ncbi:MAG: YfhO family protein [Ligilactobacillus ruminis]
MCSYQYSVNMLPLVLLLIHKVFTGEFRGWKLAVAVGYMIIANWYSAGVNCIFTGFWFVFEYARNLRHQETLVEQLVDLVKKVVSYVAAMLVGIMPGSDNQGATG